ncbi:hypothetical protein [Streptosporangium sp. 'caverna']|uniref:hypothetical protein n=1 Tax=Streptosporangium sp. 'caverna' TaxID=2202249 RepID=UPI000D7E0111|nr:hypothetical protein [Streptosporangium sp. 'caverna']AWS44505.1 hypothetical protein DKM19_27300 [Streptosporangium sp. 'caverna']
MGYPIYREVMDFAPDTLTHREKLVALVLADDANDNTRTTWNSVVDPKILRRAMVKNDRDMRKILTKLKDAGVLEQVVSGHSGSTAKFRFLPLALAVDNSVDSDAEGGSIRTAFEGDTDGKPVLSGPPSEGEGGSIWHGSRFDLNRPTPLTPHNYSSSSSPTDTSAPHHHEDEEIAKGQNLDNPTPTSPPVVDLAVEGAARHIVDRQIGIDREQARAVVALLGREAAGRGNPVGAWSRYITQFSNDQLRDAHARAAAKVDRPAAALTAPKVECDECKRPVLQAGLCGPCRGEQQPEQRWPDATDRGVAMARALLSRAAAAAQ